MIALLKLKYDGNPRTESSDLRLGGAGQTTARLRRLAGPAAWRARAARVLSLTASDLVGFLLAGVVTTAMMGFWVPGFAATVVGRQSLLLTAGAPLAIVLLALARSGHYGRRLPFWSELRDLLGYAVLAFLGSGFLQYVMQRHDARLLLGLTWALFPLAAVLLRTLARAGLARAGLWQIRVHIVGRSGTARQAARVLLSEPRLGYRIAGIVTPAELKAATTVGLWWQALRREQAEMLVLALEADDPGARELIHSLVRERVPFAAMPQLGGLPVHGFEQTSFFSHDTIMFSYRNNLARPVSRSTKIVFDVCAAAFLLVLIAPALLAIAAMVKLDGGPVFYAHRRVGAGGRDFMCLKFRSMRTDAEAMLRHVLETDAAAAAEWAETHKLRRDPRITWIGRILRTTSLDELPQLFNVLRLEMSLVGPRPIVRGEVARYADDIAFYYETRPGLTGLWQVSGRSDTSYVQRVQLDTWYVKNWTLWHDLAILAKTVPAVLKRQGAA